VPEGLDQASSAFQAAINPQASQPRDTGGRFQSVSRPEPMFEPRPVEGDEKTGDARDAGDDPRLLERERRIADGRADERDERDEGPVRGRAGEAPAEGEGEGGERSSERRPEKRGDAGPDDGHEADEGKEPKPDGEGEGEADEQGEKWALTLNGQPVEKLEVTVDGEERPVSLDECIKGYIRTETFHKRMSQVDQARQHIEAEAGNIGQARTVYQQKLQYLDTLIAQMTPQEPNWDAEFQADPAAAHRKQKTYGEIYAKRHWIDQELQRTAHETQTEYDKRSKDFAINQFTDFVREANIPDEKALTETLTLMRSYGRKEGFSEAELAQTYDKRMLRVLRKAALYDQGQSNRPKAIIPGKGKTLTPGVATPVGNATRRHIDEAQSRLAKTGRVDDAAQVMARLIR
jgi:hypothetical protein